MALDFYYDSPMSALFPGTEVIDFQTSSQLGKKLTDIFQEVIDFRENLDYSDIQNSAEVQRQYRLEQVFDHFNTVSVPAMKKVILQETGLIVKKIHTFGGINHEISPLFACDLSFGHLWEMMEVLETSSGVMNVSVGLKEVVNELRSMADWFDPKKGRVKKSRLGKNNRITVGVELYMDINCAFCSFDFIGSNLVAPLTAREIAAIMMHEIGHGMSTVEHAGDMFYAIATLDNYRHGLSKQTDPKQVLDALQNDVIPYLARQSKMWGLEAEGSNLVQKLISKLSTATSAMSKFAAENQESEWWIITIGSYAANMFWMWQMFMLTLTINGVIFVAGYFLVVQELNRLMALSFDKTLRGNKASDFASTGRNAFQMERWADEYVSRHGFGADLSTGLVKIISLSEYLFSLAGGVMSARLRHSTLFALLAKLNNWLLWKVDFIISADPIIYETNYRRIKRMVQNNYAFFRDKNDVPGAVKDMWINSTESMLRTADEMKTLSDTDFMRMMKQVMLDVASPIRWCELLSSGNIARDMEILMDRLDDMHSSRMYYLSSKFESMARHKK